MAVIPKLAVLALLGALTACTSTGAKPTPSAPSSSSPSAHVGLGGPAPSVTTVDEAFFRTPSKNIFCVMTSKSVRCDILRRNWQPPPKPSDCELDWGLSLHIDNGRAGFLCAGDSVISEAKTTLEYGHGLRAGNLLCDSESTALRCADEKTGHGFTLAVAQYDLY
jgi:hypothetical protein